MDPEIIAAIHERNLIEMVYENRLIVVQPYCYGKSSDGTSCLIAFMAEGGPPEAIGSCNLYELDKADDFNILKETFSGPATACADWPARLNEVYASL